MHTPAPVEEAAAPTRSERPGGSAKLSSWEDEIIGRTTALASRFHRLVDAGSETTVFVMKHPARFLLAGVAAAMGVSCANQGPGSVGGSSEPPAAYGSPFELSCPTGEAGADVMLDYAIPADGVFPSDAAKTADEALRDFFAGGPPSSLGREDFDVDRAIAKERVDFAMMAEGSDVPVLVAHVETLVPGGPWVVASFSGCQSRIAEISADLVEE